MLEYDPYMIDIYGIFVEHNLTLKKNSTLSFENLITPAIVHGFASLSTIIFTMATIRSSDLYNVMEA
jgi:hypothetical protein